MVNLGIKSGQGVFLRIVYFCYEGCEVLIERTSSVCSFEGAEMHMPPVAMV